MMTPRNLEVHILKASRQVHQILETFGYPNAQQIQRARESFATIRHEHGMTSPGSLLSFEISKLKKHDTTIGGLALLPSTHSSVANVCAFSDSCAETCVAYSGNGSFPTVFRSRLAKTELLTRDPFNFLVLLVDEIAKARAAHPHLAIRLNTYSDIRWERVAPWLFAYFSSVQFYDYTKHPTRSRPSTSIPQNYHLTYSVSERTTPSELRQAVDTGRPVAVVIATRSGKTNTGEMRPIPETWAGLPTVDGDATDARWEAPAGSAVILRRKHTLEASAPMITHAAKLETQHKRNTK